MRKICVIVLLSFLVIFCADIYNDMHILHEGVIRLHVVGASDSVEDQNAKLAVKDAVNDYLGEALDGIDSVENAKIILQQELLSIQTIAEQVLRSNGFDDHVTVSLGQESFPIREYETFTMPSGVYESLRIRIGNAEGKNWWCVVFPSLCMPNNEKPAVDIPASYGFSESLYDTITGESDYQIRFFILDLLGQLQNLWFDK